MATWVFEPGHSAVEFRARHMMVCWVRGHIKDVHGSLEFEPNDPTQLAIQATLDASKLWSGEPQRDEHLRSPDFLDVANHPTIAFQSTDCTCLGTNDYRVTGNLTIRGIMRPVTFFMHYLGQWRTPYWTDAGDVGPITRIGFVGEARINRHDFAISWNGELEHGGAVVGDDVLIEIDVEALRQTELTNALEAHF
jgi:polyisoprenoid-binding protein YceI